MSLIEKILSKKETHEYFIVLGIEEHRIVAAVAEILNKQVNIIGHGESEFREGENEVEASDIAISTAEKGLPENIFVRRTIFGLPAVFLDGDKVKPEYLRRIENISKTLDLQPDGFIEYPQALSSYIEKKEEASPTLLLLSIGRNYLILSHLRVGKVEKNVIVQRTESLNSDFEKILSSFDAEILPNRIIIYDEIKGVEMEKIKEELLQFAWHKHSSFLHTPKIEILEDSAIYTALVEAGAGTLIKKLHIEIPQNSSMANELPKEEEKIEAKSTENETFGFTGSESETEEENIIHIPSQTVSLPHKSNLSHLDKPPFIVNIPSIPFPLPSLSGGFLAIIAVVIFIFLSIGLGFAVLNLYPKASVNLIVYPKKSSQQLNIILTAKSEKVNPDKKIILATVAATEVAGEKSAAVTGTSKIGDAAFGEITIYNKTTVSKTFPKGTILTNGSLKFSLNEDLNIASASDTGEGLTFGKNTTKVTAVDIGSEGNLTAGSVFTIKDFPQSSYYAKNTASFTGGTSREVTSVSRDDQNNLLKSLTLDLENLAKQKIIQKLSAEDRLIEGSINSSITSKNFSKEVGSEARELTLTLTLKVNCLIYKDSDINTFARPELFSAPAGFTIDSGKIQNRINDVKAEKNGDFSASAVLTANFIPDIDSRTVLNKISGKTYKEAERYLSTNDNIGGFEIMNENDILFFRDRLPWNKNNIKINVIPR